MVRLANRTTESRNPRENLNDPATEFAWYVRDIPNTRLTSEMVW